MMRATSPLIVQVTKSIRRDKTNGIETQLTSGIEVIELIELDHVRVQETPSPPFGRRRRASFGWLVRPHMGTIVSL
jgi:hypothetical protein